MRHAFVFAFAVAALLAPAAASAQSTTRIETRPFYGATVTLEEGVRVFRTLPSDQRVIINPNGATPLSLGFEEKNIVSHNYHYGDRGTSSASASASADGGGGGFVASGSGRKGRHGSHHHGGRRHGVGSGFKR
jgi:hypothetical protein